jgi:hypothetical protein
MACGARTNRAAFTLNNATVAPIPTRVSSSMPHNEWRRRMRPVARAVACESRGSNPGPSPSLEKPAQPEQCKPLPLSQLRSAKNSRTALARQSHAEPGAARHAASNPFLCENIYCPFPDAHRDEITTGASE